MTAVALVPLTLWFVWSALRLVGAAHEDVLAWIGGPIPVVLFIALVVASFYHLSLGLQVVIEDYVHTEPARLINLLLEAYEGVIILLAPDMPGVDPETGPVDRKMERMGGR